MQYLRKLDHFMLSPREYACVALLLISMLPGCDAAANANGASGSVTGTVTLNGQPLTVGTVLMEKADQSVALITAVGPDGAFAAKTMEGKDLPVGDYRVAVSTRRIGETDPEKLKSDFSDAVPAKYHRLDTAGLVIHVVEGKNPPIAIDLKP